MHHVGSTAAAVWNVQEARCSPRLISAVLFVEHSSYQDAVSGSSWQCFSRRSLVPWIEGCRFCNLFTKAAGADEEGFCLRHQSCRQQSSKQLCSPSRTSHVAHFCTDLHGSECSVLHGPERIISCACALLRVSTLPTLRHLARLRTCCMGR